MQSSNVLLLLSVFIYATGASLLEPVIENVVHLQTALPPPDTPGIWRKKMIWKARWVKEWKLAKNWRPVWKKVWSPVEIREWVPVPKPPPPDVTASVSTGGLGDSPHGTVIYPPGPPPSVAGPPEPPSGPFPGFPPGPPPSVDGPPGPPSGPFAGYPPSGSLEPFSEFPPEGPSPAYPPSGPPEPLSEFPPGPTRGPPPRYPPRGPPQPVTNFPSGPSTPLRPVLNESPAWPTPDAQDLLSSYHTIKNPDPETNFPKPERPPQTNPPLPGYSPVPRNPQVLAQFLEPPKPLSIQASRLVNEYHYSEPANSTSSNNKPNAISPYAAKLAQAVLREQFNRSLKSPNPTERPSGLTDIVYKPNPTTTVPAPVRVTKSSGSSSTTESPSNVFIVTPVSVG